MKATYQTEGFSLVGVDSRKGAEAVSTTKVIADHSAFSLKVGSGGVKISCMEGFVWITQENDRKDYFLERGGRFAADRPGTLVVQSMAYRVGSRGESKIAIEA